MYFPVPPSQGDSLPVFLVHHLSVVDMLDREVMRHVPGQAWSQGGHGCLVHSCMLSSALGPRTQASLSTNLFLHVSEKFGGRRGPCRPALSNLISSCICQAPVFLLFLDTTWQLLEQCPAAFEFSETYLAVLHDSTRVALFGTFLFNSPHQRVQQSTVSNCRGNVK